MQERQIPAVTPRQGAAQGWLAAVVAAIAVLALVLASGSASAQIVDTLEVNAKGKEAQIAVHFTTTVQYLRHSPPGKGRILVIELQVTGSQDTQIGGRLVSETRVGPKSDLVPPFEVRYVASRNSLTIEFKRDVAWRVQGAGDGRSIYVFVPLPPDKVEKARPPAKAAARPTVPVPKAKPSAPPVPGMPVPSVPSPTVEKEGFESLASANAALAAGKLDQAIEILNHVLNLPPGGYSREAQELIGTAREKNGETEKARAEYELYLKLYTDADGVARVTQRLAALGKAPTPGTLAARVAKPVKSVHGSLATTYYRGATKYDATLLPPQPGLQPDQVSLTATDQSSFVTNVDVTGRFRKGPWDHKLVVRDTWTAALLAGQKNENRLAAAYYEMNQKERDWSLRAGRQSAQGGGVLGRFDGLWARVGLRPGLRLNAVGGQTVEYYSAPKRTIYGASVDFGHWNNALATSLYAIGQRLDGVVDRQAVGTEMRYFDASRNGFLLFDYDTKFREVNIAMLQANWLLESGTNVAFLYDRRRTPPLQVSNVSAAYSGASLGDLAGQGFSYADLLAQSKAITPISDLVSIGVTHPLSPRWQLGADVKLSKVSATEAVGQLGAAPDNGNLWVYTAQGIGTGLIASGDVFVASLSVNRSRPFDGTSLSLAYVRVIDRLRLEGNLKYYDQTDMNDIHLKRWTPSAKAAYRFGESLSFEGEAGAEFTKTRGPVSTEDTRRHYFNVGVRWDFY